MPSTRRTLLKRGVPCVLGVLAGCTDSDAPPDRQWTEPTSERRGQTIREETTMQTTTKGPAGRAVTLTHYERLVDESIRDVSTQYYARIFQNETEVESIDVSNVANDFPEQDLSRVETFIAETNFEKSALLAVQAEVPAPEYELEFDFFSRIGETTQAILHLAENGLEGSKAAFSTALVRIPASALDSLEVGIIDIADAYASDPLHAVTTFSLPNETRFASLNVGPSSEPVNTELTVPGGALLTNADVAREFVPEGSPYAGFVRETDFNHSYVLAVQTTVRNSGYYAIPQTVEREDGAVSVQLRQQNFGGGLNAEFFNLLLTRISSTDPPESGTVTIRTHDFDETVLDERQFEVSHDPEEWSKS